MWTSARDQRQAQTRRRLSEVVTGWVPTAESVHDELAGLSDSARAGGRADARTLGPEDGDPDPDQVDPAAADMRRPHGRAPAASVAWEDAAPPLPPRRIDASVLPAVLLVTVGALVGAVAVWLLAWPRGEAVTTAEAAARPASAASPAAAGASGEVTASATGTAEVVVVDVAGAVHRPGVLELPAGARVVDALAAAGGALRRADTTPLNLARILQDGEQVLVPVRGRSAGVPGASSTDAPGTVNLNTASVDQLETLPGIGPVLAQRIVDWRTTNGGFTRLDQLLEVSGIGEATFADLEPLVQV